MKLTRYSETGCVSYMMLNEDGDWVPWEEARAILSRAEAAEKVAALAIQRLARMQTIYDAWVTAGRPR